MGTNIPLIVLTALLAFGLAACAAPEHRASMIQVAGAEPGEASQVWDQSFVPVRVVPDPRLPREWLAHVRAAVDAVDAVVPGLMVLDQASGTEAAAYFEFWGLPPKGIALVSGDGGVDRWFASTVSYRRYGLVFASATKLPDDAATSYLAPQMALHEVLHVLGVAHEEDPSSVMFPLSTVWSVEFRPETRALVRSVYGWHKKE